MTSFFKGVFFVLLILPIIDGIIQIFSDIISYICVWIEIKTELLKTQLIDDLDKESSPAIGFQITPEEDENSEE